jgi:Carboxypeptidase regulatory-like domain
MSGSVSGRLRFMLLAAAVVGLLAVAPRQLCGQAVGEITGTVTDPSGAVAPHVQITAVNVATGISQSTFTTSAGAYTIARLLVGTYTVTAQEAGFRRGVAPGITLNVGQVREVNFTLALGSTKQTVTVAGLPALLDTTDNSLGATISAEEVQDLPLYGRDMTSLVELQPGVDKNPTGSMGWFTGGSWVSNGNRPETAVATMDGADTSDMEMGDTTLTNFNLDAVAQLKVLQNDYSAQYGQGGGNITEAVSASGTNQFHGSAYDFLTNGAFDARNFYSTSVPVFTYNQFGATFGGPIEKNNTFFFGSYTGLRQRETTPSETPAPTMAERNGTISEGTDMLQVPLNPDSKTILSRYPLPNDPSGLYGTGTFYWNSPSNVNDNQYSGRVDHSFSAKDRLFARVTLDNYLNPDNDSLAVEEGGPTFAGNDEHEARNYTIGETHILSPTLLNTFNFTLQRTIQGDSVAPASLTIPDSSISGFTEWGPRTFYTEYVTTTFHPSEMVNWTTGRNSFTFGGDYRREWDNGSGVTSLGPGGVFYFNPGTPLTAAIPSTNGGASLSAGTPSPSGLISMMEGDVYQYGRALSAPGYGPPGGGAVWWGLRRWTIAGYAQDFFKATRRLTLGFGLRYEYYSVPWETGDRLSGPADYGSLYGNMVVNPQPLWQPDYVSGDFGPRFSFAESMGRDTALRGGFGMFTNAIPTIYADQSLVDFPVESLNYISGPQYSLTPLAVTLPYLTSLSGQPLATNGNTKTVPPNTPVNLSPLVPILGQFSGDYASDRMRNGYTMDANLTLEHEFSGGVAAQASWVNDTGVSLYNQAYPNAFSGAEPQYTPYSNITNGALGEIVLFYNGAHSDYNALQLEARKVSAAHGLTFDANYTWGKTMSDADDLFNAPSLSGAASMNNPTCLKCEYAPAYFSVSQRFAADFIYNLPIRQWQALSRLPQRLTQGWKIAGIFQAQTGNPFAIDTQYGTAQYGYDSFNGVGTYPDLLKLPTPGPKTMGVPQFFSNAVIGNNNGMGTGYFGQPTTTSPVPGVGEVLVSPGNLGRNTFTSPAWSNLDFSLIKETRITESKTLQFRAEFYNIFNQATFGVPNETVGASGFGLIGSTATTQRYIQFALRLIF